MNALYFSADGGRTWKDPIETESSEFAYFDLKDKIALLGSPLGTSVTAGPITFDGDGNIKSWTSAEFIPSIHNDPNNHIYDSLKTIAFGENTIFVASDTSFYRSVDKGINWESRNKFEPILPEFNPEDDSEP